METILSRVCEGSKLIISGDEKQTDKFKPSEYKKSGLHFIYEKLQGIDSIAHYQFNDEDIVRHPLIGKILKIFEENEK